MKKDERNWSLVAHDPEGDRWYQAAVVGFYLRHPEALDAYPSRESFLGAQESFVPLGWELTILDSDLAQCLNEFKTSYQVLYQDPGELFLKKFAVLYHTDNFYIRVHKLIENLYQFLGKVAGIEGGSRRADPPWREQVRIALDRRRMEAIGELVRTFEGNRRIEKAIGERHLFVHRYRPEPRWPMLQPKERFYEASDYYGDGMAREIRRITETHDVDRYADRKCDELYETLQVIRQFRDRLHDLLVGKLVELASTMSPRIQRAVRSITGLDLYEDLFDDSGESA
jgi:hypothetical protein